MTNAFVYQNAPDTVQVVDAVGQHTIEEFVICDDCREAYLWPVFYSFETYACYVGTDELENDILHGEDCTGNLCPDCAGPYVEPDDPDDLRRPSE